MDISLASIKVLIIHENLWGCEDLGATTPALALKEGLEEYFSQTDCKGKFVFEALTVLRTPKAALEKLTEFKPDVAVIECSGLARIKLDEFVDQLLASPDRPKEIIPINIDVHYHFDMLVSAQKKKLRYTEKRGDSFSNLVDILENINKTYNKNE